MFTSLTPHPVIPPGTPEGGWARLWHQLGPGSRKRYAAARIEAGRLASLRYQWQQACAHVGLGLTVYTPSGVTVSVPRIERADFGLPMSFTVRLRPGQRASDIRAVERKLAAALGVAGLRVSQRAPGWADVLVIGPHDGLGYGDDGSFWDGGPRRPELRVA